MAIIKCPECGNGVSSHAETCPHCGIKISGEITICDNCKSAFFTKEGKCPQCGRELSDRVKNVPANDVETVTVGGVPGSPEGESNRSESEEKKRKIKHNYIAFIGVVLLVFLSGYFYVVVHQKRNAEMESWQIAMNSNDPDVLKGYLEEYSDAPEAHRDSIAKHLNILKNNEQEWVNVLVSNSREALSQFLENHPNSSHKTEAERKIDSLDWILALSKNTIEAMEDYKEQHNCGMYVEEANDKIQRILSQTVLPEEKQAANSILNTFFMCVNANNEEGLKNVVADVMASFLGKECATKNDLALFLHKIYKPEVESTTWSIISDMKITKKEIGDKKYAFTVVCSVKEDIVYTNGTAVTQNYSVNAKIDPNKKISEFNLDKINYE